MGQSLFKVSTVHTSEVQTSHTYKMNPAVLISAVAFACIGSTNAIFGSSIVTGTGALITGTGGTHVLLAGGTAGAVAPVAAVAPASCVKQLICDIATGTKPSENDVILSLFD